MDKIAQTDRRTVRLNKKKLKQFSFTNSEHVVLHLSVYRVKPGNLSNINLN